MEHQEKQDLISSLSQSVTKIATEALHIGPDELTQLYRAVMQKDELLLWDLMAYWEKEAMKCVEAGAHFSSMVCSVSMNESLLCYLCLLFEDDVRSCALFKKIVGNRRHASMTKLVAEWKLKTLLQLAAELNWLTANLIDPSVSSMMLEVLVEMREAPLPSDFTFSTQDLEDLLVSEPGRGLVELTQSLRNYVHPTRWLRLQQNLQTEGFNQWCVIATRLSGEIRNVLLLTAFRGHAKRLEKSKGKLTNLTGDDRKLLMTLVGQRLTEKAGIKVSGDFDYEVFSSSMLQQIENLHSRDNIRAKS